MATPLTASIIKVYKYGYKDLIASIKRNNLNIRTVGRTTDAIKHDFVQLLRHRYTPKVEPTPTPPPHQTTKQDWKAIKALLQPTIQLEFTYDNVPQPAHHTIDLIDFQALTAAQIRKFRLPNQYPFWIRLSAAWTSDHNTKTGLIKVISYQKASSAKSAKKIIRSQLDRLADYNVLRELDAGFAYINGLKADIMTNRNKQRIVRVANYHAENCLINVIRKMLGDQADKAYNKLPHLRPTDDNKTIYVGHDDIKQIAASTRTNIVCYTQLGALNNTPWQSFGTAGRRKIHVQLSDEHATIMPGKYVVNKIEYHETIPHIPDVTNVIGYHYDSEDCFSPAYYLTIDHAEVTIHKKFRPSTITADPNDDTNLAYAYDIKMEQLLYHRFKIDFDLKTLDDPTIRSIVKASEHFITRRKFAKITSEMTEVDQNRSFPSGHTCEYYVGYPSNNLVPTHRPSKYPAYVILKNIHNPPQSFKYFFEYQDGPIVLPTPVFRYLHDLQVQMDVDYYLDTPTFKDINILDYCDQFNIDPSQKKLFSNQLIGRTITGGIKECKRLHFTFKSPTERDQLIHECQTFGYDYNVYDHVLVAEVPNPNKGFFQFHSYILAYSSIAMMTKWSQLEALNHTIIGYNVDALVINSPTYHEHSDLPGAFKTQSTSKKRSYDYIPLRTTINPPNRQIPPIQIPNRPQFFKNTVIIGPAGIGKSYPFVTDPFYDQLLLTPTRELRDAHLNTEGIKTPVHTAHKAFQFTLSDPVFYKRRSDGTIPSPHATYVIDELSMFNESQWDLMIERSKHSRIIALGDFHQIKNSIGGRQISLKYFEDRGWDVINLTRTPDMKCRHQYDFGLQLDQLRIDPDISATIASTFPHTIFKPSDVIFDQDRMVVGDHTTAHAYNIRLKDHLATVDQDHLFPVKTIGSTGTYKLIPLSSDLIWWDRLKMSDQQPKNTRFEPAFAVTIDSFQGKTHEHILYIHLESLTRDGALYTAMTRTRSKDFIRLLVPPPP
jgi:hypothetical protein